MHAGLLHHPHRQAARGSCSSLLCLQTNLIRLPQFTRLPLSQQPAAPLPAPNPHLAPSLVSSVSPASEQGLGQKGGLSSVISPPSSNSPQDLIPTPTRGVAPLTSRPGRLQALLSSPKVSALSPHTCSSQACGDLGPWEAPTLIHHPAVDSLYTPCPHLFPESDLGLTPWAGTSSCK